MFAPTETISIVMFGTVILHIGRLAVAGVGAGIEGSTAVIRRCWVAEFYLEFEGSYDTDVLYTEYA